MRPRFSTPLVLLVLTAMALGLLIGRRTELRASKDTIIDEILGLRWICYAPTRFNPERSIQPTRETIAADLELIAETGFDGIITYESSGPHLWIPEEAGRRGLRVIQGVWGPADREELRRAAGLSGLVMAYCVGNEGLDTRYTMRELDEGATYLANLTRLPVAISEQIHLYFSHPSLVETGDWVFPIVHPHFGGARQFDAAIEWVESNLGHLRVLAKQRRGESRVFAKEVGMPSGGDSAYSQQAQERFLTYMLEQGSTPFAVFEAFDRIDWEHISAVEPYWGIYDSRRSPKLAHGSIARILSRSGRAK
jgi:exo-beta-1,3-glucanase (GH17 family)